MQKNTGCSWSGGKDSCYALMKAKQFGYDPKILVNMMNENGEISRSHGLPFSILQQQAAMMNLPIVAQPTSWQEYEHHFINTLHKIKEAYSIDSMVFGDIDLQPHRDWEEKVCTAAGLDAFLPIWQRDRKELVLEMLAAGIETMIVSCNTIMGEAFLGKILNHELISELEKLNVDVCGENGEFHTVVINCPLFKEAIKLPSYSTAKHQEYFFLVWDQ